jgi:hypothetical protein
MMTIPQYNNIVSVVENPNKTAIENTRAIIEALLPHGYDNVEHHIVDYIHNNIKPISGKKIQKMIDRSVSVKDFVNEVRSTYVFLFEDCFGFSYFLNPKNEYIMVGSERVYAGMFN